MTLCTGRQFPTAWQRRLSKLRFDLRERLSTNLQVETNDSVLRFVCHSPMEEMRVRSLLVKEEGTIDWIRQYVRPGEVFLDIGANIGLYSLVAANVVGAKGRVYSIEPHAVNVISLMQNVAANNFQDRIQVLSTALHNATGIFDFNYYSLEPGSAMSQLGELKDAYEQRFEPVMKELKLAMSLDDLIERHGLLPPQHIKIDVDGNERQVIEGMARLLQGKSRPHSVQVEINERDKAKLLTAFAAAGYAQTQRHDTAAGKASLARGVDPDKVPHNAVFESRQSPAYTQ
jgi:FkbM family methyltransferase